MFPDAGDRKPDRGQDQAAELHDEELDDISGGILGEHPEFRGRGIQPDSAGAAAHR
jgi:hypothetical protein